MVDYFAETTADDPFALVADVPVAAPTLSPEYDQKRARIAALAKTDPKQPDIVGQMHSLIEETQNAIALYGDQHIRVQVANRQKAEQIQGFSDLLRDKQLLETDPTIAVGAAQASYAAFVRDEEQQAKYALEQEAVNRIQELAAEGDLAQARMLLNNLEHGDANHVIRDINTKTLILERELEKIKGETEGDWVGSAAHFVLSLTGVYNSIGDDVNVKGGLGEWYDWLFSGRRKQIQSNSLWNMPVDQFSDFVEQKLLPDIRKNATLLGFEDKHKELSTLSKLKKPSTVVGQNIEDGINNLGWIGPAEVTKGFSIPSLLIRNGARKEASQILAQTALEIEREGAEAALKKTGVSADEAVDHMLPNVVNPAAQTYKVGQAVKSPVVGEVGITELLPGERAVVIDAEGSKSIRPLDELETEAPSSVVSIQAEVNNQIEATKQAATEFQDLQQLGRLTAAEMQEAVDAAKARIEKAYGSEDGWVKDVRVTGTQLSDNTQITSVEFTLGNFTTEEEAARYAKEIVSGGQIVVDDSGQYSVRVRRDISETGFHTDVLKAQATGFLSRFLLSARSIGDRLLANQAQAAGNTRNRVLKTFVRRYTRDFATLSTGERESLAQVLAVGENQGKWFSPDELELLYERAYKRPPSAKEIQAYHTARRLNDIEYMLRTDEIYKQKVVQGFESVSFARAEGTADRVNAKVIDDWSVLVTDRVYNLSDGISYSGINPLHEADQIRFKQEGYSLLKLDEAMEMTDGTTTNVIIAKKSDFVREPLRRDQVKYRAGGHRIYKDSYFAKQARIGVQPDGEKFMKNPSTYIVGTKAQVDLWVSQMEAARLAFKEGADHVAIGKLTPPYISGEKFVAGMIDGTFDPEQSFRTMFDREIMPEYVNNPGYADMRNTETTDVEQFLHTNGRMYYSHKGEVLPDYQGSMAPTLDPYRTINKALHNVANLASFSDYKISASERWHHNFGGYLNQRAMTPMQAIREGTFGLNVPEAIRQAAEAQRDVIRRALGWRTEFDRQQEIYTRRFAEWVAGDDPYSFRNKAATAVSNWFDTHHPVQALRGLAFDLKLGLFNVAQFPLQIGTMVAATSISPKFGMQGMIGLFPLKAYMTKSGSEDMLNLLVQRGVHESTGFATADEFKEYMRFAKKSGFFDLGSTHQLINDGGPNSVVGAFQRADNIRESLRFWFYEGEWWNRAVAMRIAWGETREKLPNLRPGSNEFLLEVTGKAEEFAFSMSDQSAAAWQKGLLSIPTQFWAYNARMLEAMFGKTLTVEQKARLIIGQTLMYGAAGVPIAPFLLEQRNKQRGSVAPINSFEGFVTRGMLDQVMYHMTGQDLLVSKRYGTGGWITDTIRDLFGMSAYGEKSPAEMIGGASYNIAYQGFETLLDLVKYSAYESGGVDPERPITREALLRLASNVTTFSNLHKAYMVHKYGELLSNKGTVLAANVPSQSAWAVALSVQPGEIDQVSAAFGYLEKDDEAVEEAVKFIQNHRTRMMNEPANRQEISEEIQAYINLLPPEIRNQALRKAQSRLQPSLLDGLKLQVERDRIRAEALRSMEEGEDGSN